MMIQVDKEKLIKISDSEFFKEMNRRFENLEIYWDPEKNLNLYLFQEDKRIGELSTGRSSGSNIIYQGLIKKYDKACLIINSKRKREDFNDFPFDINRLDFCRSTDEISNIYEEEKRKKAQELEDERVLKKFKIPGLEKREIEYLQNSLRPKKGLEVGFIGDSENLRSIIEQDKKILFKLGITYQQISDKLDYLIEKAFEAFQEIASRSHDLFKYYETLSQGITIDDRFIISIDVRSGRQICPWCKFALSNYNGSNLKLMTAKSNFIIFNKKTSFNIGFSGLLPHLIKDHEFFEGRETNYRLEPLKAILTLDLESEHYTRSQIEDMWYEQLKKYSGNNNEDILKSAICGFHNFTKKADLPEILSQMIINLRIDKKYNLIQDLITLAGKLPNDNGKERVGRELTGSISYIKGIKEESDYDENNKTRLLSSLKIFKREFEGTQHRYFINGEYWPEYIITRKKELGDSTVSFYVKYVEDQNFSLQELCQKSVDPFNRYYSIENRGPITEERLLCLIEREDHFNYRKSELNKVLEASGSFEIRLENKLDFYIVAMNLSALLMLNSQFELSTRYAISISGQLGRFKEKKRLESIYEQFKKIV